ncbi:hypothetical protein QBZ16_005177 [Prototheca wickerhamii]|uniref:Tyrosine specific protein phosphatases domain-containing protein n=1 Tax=Prototheca wickerhamii TaxID=3111 RepID=A0AAD9MGH9_PROWI|nr:hypothetical protein QBZ16_005177 [Prototheca wickerhamii]
MPDHNRALPCQRCTGQSEDVYGTPAVVYHVDLLPLSVSLNILHHLPGRLQVRVIACAATKQAPEPIVAAAIADPSVMGYSSFYKILLRKAMRPLARAIRLFSNPGATPILMHCIHGKDRTGLVAMFLLLICDVPPSAIVEDYVRSDSALRESRDKNELVSIPEHLRTNEVMAASAQVLEDLLGFLQTHYGGPIAYLRRAGITDAEIASIRRLLLRAPGEGKAPPGAAAVDVAASAPEAAAPAPPAPAPHNPEQDPDFETRLSIGQYREEDLPPLVRSSLSGRIAKRASLRRRMSAPASQPPDLHVVEE